MINTNILSIEEIIRYVENGLIDFVPAQQVLEIIQLYSSRPDENEKESLEKEAYHEGYMDAIDKMRQQLDYL